MRGNLFKILLICLFLTIFIGFELSGVRVAARSTGPGPSVSGAPGEGTCTNCHSGGPTGGTLSVSGVPGTYVPNQEYNVTVTLTQSNRAGYGFQLTAVDDAGKRAGVLTPSDNRTQTQLGTVNNNQRQYINHTLAGTPPASTGVGSWTFKWKAPAASVGRITFYLAGNAANGDGTPGGDSIYTINQSIQPGNPVPGFASVSAASFMATLATESISAGFGTGLSNNVVSANSLPLPKQLDGTEVKVRDAMGTDRNASLFFVSPQQINYMIPTGSANGNATVSVVRSGNIVAQGMILIDPMAPGLFTANSNGRDVASANILRVRQNGSQSYEPVAQFNPANNQFVGLPIDLGPNTDQVYLILYGTAFRGVTSLQNVTCTIGGEPAQVLFAGASPDWIGLDQANVRIPRTLIGRGKVDIVFTVNGKTANQVNVTIK